MKTPTSTESSRPGAVRHATREQRISILTRFLQIAPDPGHRRHIASRRIKAGSQPWLFTLGVASLWLGFAGCSGGNGGGGSGGSAPPPPAAGADLSGPWTFVIALQGAGDFQELYSHGSLQIQAAGGSSNAAWRGSDTVVFADNRRESHSSSSMLTVRNNGSSMEFEFSFSHSPISCTYTAEISSATINSFEGNADCPASGMQGSFVATRGIQPGEPMPDITAVDAVDMSSCALGSDGRAFCWGPNSAGQLGTGGATPSIVAASSNSHIAFKKVSLSTGGAHACGLDVNGQAYCWGNMEGGRMGNGVRGGLWTHSDSAIAVAGGLTFTDIAAGGDHVCAIVADGSAWCWGHNASGQLGTGDFVERLAPTKISSNTRFTSITAHQLITCGIATDDSAWCWGNGYMGGLGNGTRITTNVPVAVSGQLQFASLQLGVWSACGVTIGGDGYCWGSNMDGELGAGLTSEIELEPVPVAGGLKWKNISPGILYSCGVATDGVGYCWGGNYWGERGDGGFPASSRNVPEPVAGDLLFQLIDADWHSCGVTIDGDVYCWGPGFLGSIGDGRLMDVGVPTLVTGS